MPVSGKNYATLKDFIDNAPKIQQKEFWKHTTTVAKRCMAEKGKVWISVHGLGVYLFQSYTCKNINNSKILF